MDHYYNLCQVGTVSILVNNAGIVSGSALLDTPDNRSLFLIYLGPQKLISMYIYIGSQKLNLTPNQDCEDV